MTIFHLQKIMGHSVLQTTRQYVQLDIDELKQAHNKYSIWIDLYSCNVKKHRK